LKRLLAVVAGGFGLAAYVRRRRRRAAAPEPGPADELREKLAQSRTDQSRADQSQEPEAVGEPEAAPDELDERRRDVHARARQAIDELE
jgi:hypothetical protein